MSAWRRLSGGERGTVALFDGSGHTIKRQAAGSRTFTKSLVDSLGRTIKTFVGYDLDEGTWNEAADLDGDTILEQVETTYDAAGSVIATVRRTRLHTAADNQTGPLHDVVTDPKARVSYSATWYDGAGRPIALANYGANGSASFERPETAPARSDDVLVSSTVYNDRGGADSTVDPAGREQRQTFDDAGRLIETMDNYQPGATAPDKNRTIRRTYTTGGQLATLTAVNPATGDQVTRYVYGTTLRDSHVARNDLLRAEIYPDSDDPFDGLASQGDDLAYDRVEYGYDRQGQVIRKQDQNQTVHAYDYDALGRQVQDRVVALGAGVDGHVRRIGWVFDLRGRQAGVASYSDPRVGAGAVVNDVRFDYNGGGSGGG